MSDNITQPDDEHTPGSTAKNAEATEAGTNRVVNDDDAGTYTDIDLPEDDDVKPGSGTA